MHSHTYQEYMPLRYIDLFAGIGGFHLALQRLGHQCVFASELKADLRRLYAINFPGCEIQGDITQIRPENIPAHDILCAGFPCQPFSQAGKQQGFNDEKKRGNLFENICEIVAYHRPRYILLENVSNLKGHDKGNTWREIYRRLHDRYHCQFRILRIALMTSSTSPPLRLITRPLLNRMRISQTFIGSSRCTDD